MQAWGKSAHCGTCTLSLHITVIHTRVGMPEILQVELGSGIQVARKKTAIVLFCDSKIKIPGAAQGRAVSQECVELPKHVLSFYCASSPLWLKHLLAQCLAPPYACMGGLSSPWWWCACTRQPKKSCWSDTKPAFGVNSLCMLFRSSIDQVLYTTFNTAIFKVCTCLRETAPLYLIYCPLCIVFTFAFPFYHTSVALIWPFADDWVLRTNSLSITAVEPICV